MPKPKLKPNPRPCPGCGKVMEQRRDVYTCRGCGVSHYGPYLEEIGGLSWITLNKRNSGR